MEPIQTEVLIRQVESLADDLADHAGPVSERVGGLLTPQEWAEAGTVYLTGDGDSYHAACAEPSPGIRTYQASLLGLLLTAIELGQAGRQRPAQQARALRDELSALCRPIAATAAAIKDQCRDVAGIAAASPVLVMTGSGPSYGSALFAAAKMTETAGVFAAGQDLEEWRHVERFAYPDAMPVFVIAPPGRSIQHAAALAEIARQQNRRVIAVTDQDDTDVTASASAVLPVRGRVREEFSPLLYHVFAGYVASYLAERLNRLPFQADRLPRIPQSP